MNIIISILDPLNLPSHLPRRSETAVTNMPTAMTRAETPMQMLSLPYDKIGQLTTILQVQQPVEVLAGRVAPWFGQIGGGIQYQLGNPLNQLISEGIIKIFRG